MNRCVYCKQERPLVSACFRCQRRTCSQCYDAACWIRVLDVWVECGLPDCSQWPQQYQASVASIEGKLWLQWKQ